MRVETNRLGKHERLGNIGEVSVGIGEVTDSIGDVVT